jgi:hypothetical protein
MRTILLAIAFSLALPQIGLSQNIEDLVSFMPWKNIVLCNEASFKNLGKLNWGSGFLIQHNDKIIACTARDFTGTVYTHGEMLKIKDFESEMNFWKMYISDNPGVFLMIDSLSEKDKIEKSFAVFMISKPYLSFTVRELNNQIVPLLPNLNKVRNGDTLYLAGYDNSHNLKLIQGIVETPLNEKYADPEIRLKTDDFMYYRNFVGGPIVNKNGEAVGLINRAYRLHKNKKGKIISDESNAEGSYFEYFVNGTSVRSVFGKEIKKR